MTFEIHFAPVSANEDWIKGFRLFSRDTQDTIDLTDCVVTLNIYDWQNADCRQSLLSASSNANPDIITFPYPGIFFVSYLAQSKTAFSGLSPGAYRVIITITRDVYTREIVRGILPVRGTR